MTLEILYEDENVVVVNKPAGLMTHPDGRNTEETASDWFARKYPKSATVGETQRLQDGSEILRPGVVHRLDRETSGALLFTKTPEAHAYYKQAFQERRVEKTYLAFVYGVPKQEKGTIDFSIGRSNKDFRLRSAQPKAKGILREAITLWEKVSDIGTHTLLRVIPKTGRTHQIRVHLKAIHHPIVCDPLYAPNHPCDLSLTRLGLHAYQLSFLDENGEQQLVTAPIPKDMTKPLKLFPETEGFLAEG